MHSKMCVYEVEVWHAMTKRARRKVGSVLTVGAYHRDKIIRIANRGGHAKVVNTYDLENVLRLNLRLFKRNSDVAYNGWWIFMDSMARCGVKRHQERLRKLVRSILFEKEMEHDADD